MSYSIDLIHILMGDVCVIIGIYWFSKFSIMIDCEGQRVVVRIPIGGELVINEEGTRLGLAFCSAARAREYI